MPRKKTKHIEHADEKKIHLVGFISFLLGFSAALLVYVESSYFKLALGSENVSIFYFVAYAVALLGLLNMHHIIKKIGRATAFFIFLFFQIISITLLSIIAPSMLGIILLMVYIVTSYLVYVILDIILETYSEDKKSGTIRGMHLLLASVGFLLGPYLSSQILENFGYSGLFLVALIINMFIFVVGLVSLNDDNGKFLGELTVKDLVKKIFVNDDLMRIYGISFALEFFYALMTIYTTIYLLDRGLSWSQIGIIFTIMLVPFILFGYVSGIIADKYLGEKEMIVAALLLMAFSTAGIFFIVGNSVWVWGLVLFATRVGASIVETLRDSYFYKRIDGRDMDLISFFRTSRSVAYMAATGVSAILLIFFPVKSIFLFVAVVLLAALYPALTLIDNECERD